MKMKNLLIFAILALSMSFTSCGSDVDCQDEASFYASIEIEVDAFLDAALTFAFDPTSENCNAYKDAINAYVKALKPYRDCLSGSDRDEFDATIAESEQSADDLEC
jgi:hypothetical protein